MQYRDSETHNCRHVGRVQDQCAFIKRYCQEEDDGLISYLQLFYCTLSTAKPVAWLLLLPWIGLLFTAIGTCAGDFFAVNLSSVARSLHMSDTFAGVTLLAFGNGAPDIFSTWAAFTSNNAELAIGELVGAASFIITVVAGSLAFTTAFRVPEVSFIRDAAFLLMTACLLLSCFINQELQLWHGVLMIGIYITYVLVVMGYHWWKASKQGTADDHDRSSEEEDHPTRTESQPLLRQTHAQHDAGGHRTPSALYREIGTWRHAHGMCITASSDYIVQPSLAGSFEHNRRHDKRQQKSNAMPPGSTNKPHPPAPRAHEEDDRILRTLFPSLQNLSQQAPWHMAVNIFTALPFLLFKLTVPVVDNEHSVDCDHGWDRWLLMMQLFAAPQFVWAHVWLSSDTIHTLGSWVVPAAWCLVASMILALMLLTFTSNRRQPRFYPLLSVLGFAMSAFWISIIADEVVSIMQAIGVLSGLSQAILGYTLFAIGNSLDDWVANVTVSRHGHPVMALSACFGGPLLNILLGLGGSVTYVTLRNARMKNWVLAPVLLNVDHVLVVTAAAIALVVIISPFMLRWNQWQMSKSFGIGLILIWVLLTAGNVALELVL